MSRCIKVSDLKAFLKETCIITNPNEFNEYIKSEEKEMVSVADIEKLIKKYEHQNVLNFKHMFSEFRQAMSLPPKRYGGLTIEEWEQLNTLDFIYVLLSPTRQVKLSKWIIKKQLSKSAKILSDPEGFLRYHDGSEQPIPDNVIIEKARKDNDGYTGKAIDVMWLETFGYRILGVDGYE